MGEIHRQHKTKEICFDQEPKKVHFNIPKEIPFFSPKINPLRLNPSLCLTGRVTGVLQFVIQNLKKCSNSTLFQTIYDYSGIARKWMSILGKCVKVCQDKCAALSTVEHGENPSWVPWTNLLQQVKRGTRTFTTVKEQIIYLIWCIGSFWPAAKLNNEMTNDSDMSEIVHRLAYICGLLHYSNTQFYYSSICEYPALKKINKKRAQCLISVYICAECPRTWNHEWNPVRKVHIWCQLKWNFDEVWSGKRCNFAQSGKSGSSYIQLQEWEKMQSTRFAVHLNWFWYLCHVTKHRNHSYLKLRQESALLYIFYK